MTRGQIIVPTFTQQWLYSLIFKPVITSWDIHFFHVDISNLYAYHIIDVWYIISLVPNYLRRL